MATSYIPAKDADYAIWMANFEAIVATDYASLGLIAGQATAVTNANTIFQAAFTLSSDPLTRTPVTIANKDVARASLTSTVRPIAIQVRNNPSVSDGVKTSLGLTVPSLVPTPVPTPTTFPVLGVVSASPGVHKLDYKDDATPTTKAKPYGALQLQLWRAVGTVPAPDPSTAVFFGVYTKSPLLAASDPSDAGKVATYFARWVTRTGLVGPWSSGVSMTIAW